MTSETEKRRVAEQNRLDSERNQELRNENGQFATPYNLALEISEVAFSMMPDAKTCIEPACGTGAFISAALECSDGIEITAIEKDPAYYDVANSLWSSGHVRVVNSDFFDYVAGAKNGFDLLLANPPYTRHHHIAQEMKDKYRSVTHSQTKIKISQLAGLHAYFVLSGTSLLNENGIAAWLIPAETFSVNFGKQIKKYLTSMASIERIHFFEENDLQFDDALVSSCVVFVRMCKCNDNHIVELTKGGSLLSPDKTMTLSVEELNKISKWQHAFRRINKSGTTVGSFMRVSRGVSSGDDKFFVKDRDEWHSLGIEDDWLQPVLPPPRYLVPDIVTSTADGWPVETNRAMLRIGRDVDENDMPEQLLKYLSTCSEKSRSSYTLTHRNPWYSVENRSPAPILCTYMSRSKDKPFRFIRNKSNAITTMAYLCMYPLNPMCDEELDDICIRLQQIDAETLVACSREYGGGLRKLEPSELLLVPM